MEISLRFFLGDNSSIALIFSANLDPRILEQASSSSPARDVSQASPGMTGLLGQVVRLFSTQMLGKKLVNTEESPLIFGV